MTSTEPSIGDLTNAMKQLTQTGAGKDTKLSSSAQQKYTKLISDYRTALNEQRNSAAQLTNYGNPGGWGSAQATVWQLQGAVTGPNGIVETLDKYLAYLDEFEKTVNAAFNRMQADDKGS
jgi:hypothetical protein